MGLLTHRKNQVVNTLISMKNKHKEAQFFKSNVKALFEEIIRCGGSEVAAVHMPLRITFQILLEVANRANQLQDPKLNSLMARLALYQECDPYSESFKGFDFSEKVVNMDKSLYKIK